jgi:hypothetical protein
MMRVRMHAVRSIGEAALIGLLAVGLAACGGSNTSPHKPATTRSQIVAAPSLRAVVWRGKYAGGCGPASLAPVAFEKGDRVAYVARGSVGNTVTIGVLRGSDAIEILVGPRPGGQAILPQGVLRIVALSRGCWSVLREDRPEPESREHSLLTTVGSATP